MSRGWRRWQPWTVSFLGATLFGLTAADFALGDGTRFVLALEAVGPLVTSLAVVGFGLWLHTTAFEDDDLTTIAAWCLGGAIGVGVLGGWSFYVMRIAGLAPTHANYIVLSSVAFGGALGAVGGVYDARKRVEGRRAALAHAALDATNDGVAIFDGDGRIVRVNDAFVEKYGYDEPTELLGEHWDRIVTEETMGQIEAEIADEVLETGAWRDEVTAKRRDGSTFPVKMSAAMAEGNRTVAVVRDVTERTEREAELRYRTSLLSAQFEAGRDGILILDDDWEVLACNDRFAEMWDLPRDAVEEAGFDVLGSVGERLATPSALRDRVEYLRDNPTASDSSTVQTRDGRILDRYSAPVSDEGINYGRVFTFRDVSEAHRRDRMVEALHQASHQLAYADSPEAVGKIAVDVARQVFTRPVSGVWLHDEDGGALRPPIVSPMAEERFRGADDEGTLRLEAMGGVADVIDGDEVAVLEGEALAAASAFSGLDLDSLVLAPLGGHGVMALGDPEQAKLSGPEHQLVGILRQHVIAALDRVERASTLAEREQRLATIVQNVPIVLFAFDPEGVFTLSEGVGLQAIGLAPGEVVGDRFEEVFAPAPDLIELCRRALDGEEIAETVGFGGRAFEAWFDPVLEGGEVRQVIGTAVDVSARARYERSIEALHSATREMMVAADTEAIGRVVTDAARDVLSLPMSGVWIASGGGNRLVPVSMTPAGRELVGDGPTFEPGDGLAWRAFDTGETLRFDDVSEEPQVYDPETPIRSELIVPIGRYGVLVSGSTVRADFDENDVALAELLAANAAVAIDRTERAAALRRQTNQFEFFNSILRHDVLNGMTVIRSRGEFLADSVEGEDLRFAETIVEWSEDIVDVVGRVRRVLETLTAERETRLEPVDVAAIIDDRVERVNDTYPEVAFSVDVPAGLFVTADEILSDVLGNVITNAIEHNVQSGLEIHVDAGAEGEEATIRIADNGTGIDDGRKEAVFRRGETGHAKATGSGFGLFFVDAMVDRYDGAVWVEDNDAGGATFVVQLPVAGGPGE